MGDSDCPHPSVHGNPFRYCPYCDWMEKAWPPPKHDDWGVFRCRDHWHVGFLWHGIDYDDDPDFGKVLYWEEAGVGTTFEKASKNLVSRPTNG